MEIEKELQEAINLQQQGNFNEAIKVYEEILKKTPNLAEVQNNLGILLKSLNRLDEAEKIFTKTISLKPDFIHVLSKGKIIKTGESELGKELEKSGYANL